MARVCNSDNPSEALSVYRAAAPFLKDCRFVLASKSGATPGFAVNRTFSDGASVRSLFKTNNVLVLDDTTVAEMDKGTATYPIDFSISLDTQALSYLAPHLAGKIAGIPLDFKEVFEFIARDDVHVDPIPYMLENLHNLESEGAAAKILEKLKAYEVLRTIDLNWLSSRGEARSTLSSTELTKRANELLSRMQQNRADSSLMTEISFRHQFMYIQLLKMACIQLKSPSQSINKKMASYAEFCDSRLATMSGRETAIARAYFERGQQLEFFGKIQKKGKDLFGTLDGMAWDLWHVRQLEIAMTLKPDENARYFFPALLTFDKRFIEIMDLYPLKACAYRTNDPEPMPFFDGDFFDLVATDSNSRDEFIERFYSSAARDSRVKRRESAKSEIPNLIVELEADLGHVANVEPPLRTAFSIS